MDTLLLVDDDEYFREITRRQLEKQGYKVIEAADGPSAMEGLLNNSIDLILLDYILPNITGDQLAKELMNKSSHTPVIFLSGADPEILSAVDFNGILMSKPIDTANLLNNIKKLIQESKQRTA